MIGNRNSYMIIDLFFLGTLTHIGKHEFAFVYCQEPVHSSINSGNNSRKFTQLHLCYGARPFAMLSLNDAGRQCLTWEMLDSLLIFEKCSTARTATFTGMSLSCHIVAAFSSLTVMWRPSQSTTSLIVKCDTCCYFVTLAVTSWPIRCHFVTLAVTM